MHSQMSILALQDARSVVTSNTTIIDKASTIIIARISPDTEDEFILKLLKFTGSVKSWSRMRDPITDQKLPSAKAVLEGPLYAFWAVSNLNGVIIDGTDIVVKADERIHISKEEDLFNRTLELARELAAEKMGRRYANPFKANRPAPRNSLPLIDVSELDLDVVEEMKTEALIQITRHEREFAANAQQALQERATAKGYSLEAVAEETFEEEVEGVSPEEQRKLQKLVIAEEMRQQFAVKILSGAQFADPSRLLSGAAMNRFEQLLESHARDVKHLTQELKSASLQGGVDLAAGLEGGVSVREKRRLADVRAVLRDEEKWLIRRKALLREDIEHWSRNAAKKERANKIDSEEVDFLMRRARFADLMQLRKEVRPGSSAERRAARDEEIKRDAENRAANPPAAKRPKLAPVPVEDPVAMARRLIALVPRDDAALFEFNISDVLASPALQAGVEGKVGTWLKGKLMALMGGETSDVESVVVEALQNGIAARDLIEIVQLSLSDAAEDFVRRLWQMLAFEQLVIVEKRKSEQA